MNSPNYMKSYRKRPHVILYYKNYNRRPDVKLKSRLRIKRYLYPNLYSLKNYKNDLEEINKQNKQKTKTINIRIDKPKYCKLCNKQLEIYNQSYCNNCKSKESFKEHQRQIVNASARRWYKKPGNKERVYAHLKRYRKENKQNINIKNNSRKRTSHFYLRGRLPVGERICKDCGSKVYVQFHHEIYPSKLKDIIQAIKNNKIYFLCRKCHGKKRRK